MKNYLLTLFISTAFFTARAGFEVLFCEQVQEPAICVAKSTEFNWEGERMMLKMIVKGESTLSTEKIYYKVYEMDNDQVGSIFAELVSHVRPEWEFAVKNIYFFKPGYYKVETYNAAHELLNNTYVTITER